MTQPTHSRIAFRLEQSDPVFTTADGLKDHVSLIIDMLELTNEADILVGSAEEEGLTFEQKKRLSIAAELAASPSIVFLGEWAELESSHN